MECLKKEGQKVFRRNKTTIVNSQNNRYVYVWQGIYHAEYPTHFIEDSDEDAGHPNIQNRFLGEICKSYVSIVLLGNAT